MILHDIMQDLRTLKKDKKMQYHWEKAFGPFTKKLNGVQEIHSSFIREHIWAIIREATDIRLDNKGREIVAGVKYNTWLGKDKHYGIHIKYLVQEDTGILVDNHLDKNHPAIVNGRGTR